MGHQRSSTVRDVADVVSSALMTFVGAWLLVLVAGTVALLAVVLVAGLYAPLRCRTIAADEPRAPFLGSARPARRGDAVKPA